MHKIILVQRNKRYIPMGTPDRIHSRLNLVSQRVEWFLRTREGELGPYHSREIAEQMLDAMIDRCLRWGDDGGRSRKTPAYLSQLPAFDD